MSRSVTPDSKSADSRRNCLSARPWVASIRMAMTWLLHRSTKDRALWGLAASGHWMQSVTAPVAPGSALAALRVITFLVLAFCSSIPIAHADTAQYFYDPAGRLIGMIDPVNGSAQYGYDATGNILAVATNPISALVVVQASPVRGAVGTTVTIAGTGFGTTANTTVAFNGTPATPTAVTATSITVQVPSGATTGPIAVTTPSGTSSTVSTFAVGTAPLPAITGFSPTTVAIGATVTISGQGFDPNPANDMVYFNGQLAYASSVTATTLTVIVPQAASGKIVVKTPEGAATSSNDLIIAPTGYAATAVASAQRLTLPTGAGSVAASASVGSSGQVALMMFDVSQGTRINALVSATTIGSGYLVLFAPNGTQAGTLVLGANAFLEPPLATATGTYVLAVLPIGTATGSVNLTVYNSTDVTGTVTIGGSPVSLTTTVAGQNMSLTFSGTTGQRVSLLSQVSSGLTATFYAVSLTEPDGATTLYTDGLSSSATDFSDALTLPASGTYTILLNPRLTGTGTATFTVSIVPPDATGAVTIGGGAVNLTTTTPGQNMSLTFSGTAGQRVSLLSQPASSIVNACYTVTLTQPDGSTQLYNNFSCSASNFSDILILPTSGTYTIFLNPSKMGTGMVTFTLYSVPPDVTGTITIGGGAASLTTTAPGQNMGLTFSGTAGQRISLLAQGSSGVGCYNVTLTEPDGQTQLYKTLYCTNGYSDLLVLPATGTYSIYLDPMNWAVGTISTTLYNVPPDVIGTITIGGSAVSLTTTAPGQNMSLTFSGTAGQRISLLAQGDSGVGCYYVTVTEPDGYTQLYKTLYCTNGFSDVLVLPATGTYSIYLDPQSTAVGTISTTLYSVPPDASATVTPGGGTVSLTTTAPGENMGLTFSGTASQRVSLLTQPTTGIANTCYTVTITAPNGSTQLYNSFSCSASDFSGALSLASTGTYTIAVNPVSMGTGTVSFTLYDLPADALGTMSIGGGTISLTTTVPGQAARAGFTGTAVQGTTMTVGTQPSSCFAIKILEPDGTTVLRSTSVCSTSYSSGSLSLPASGTYTVIVTPSGTATGTYTVGVTSP